MPYLHPVLDTNIYRTLDSNSAVELKQIERHKSIVALGSYWPAIELGAHLADPSDEAHRIAHRALQAMWQHTHRYDGSTYIVPLIADVEAQLAHRLFQHTIADGDHDALVFGYALGMVGAAAGPDVPAELQTFFTSMRDHVSAREIRFTQDMQAIARQLDPSASGWRPFVTDAARRKETLALMRERSFPRTLARLRVEVTAENIGKTPSSDELDHMADTLMEQSPTPFFFYRNLLTGLIESGTDFSIGKHANSFWDLQLCFMISPFALVDGIPTLLVTNEGKIRTAARDAGHGDYVLTFAEYREALQSCRLYALAEQFEARLAA